LLSLGNGLLKTQYDSCVPRIEPCQEQEPLMEHEDGSPNICYLYSKNNFFTSS